MRKIKFGIDNGRFAAPQKGYKKRKEDTMTDEKKCCTIDQSCKDTVEGCTNETPKNCTDNKDTCNEGDNCCKN